MTVTDSALNAMSGGPGGKGGDGQDGQSEAGAESVGPTEDREAQVRLAVVVVVAPADTLARLRVRRRYASTNNVSDRDDLEGSRRARGNPGAGPGNAGQVGTSGADGLQQDSLLVQ